MTKIDIFSGFLGSGKTTLIKKLVAESFQGQKVVLIENEFGEINIDSGFLKDSGIEITEMSSGCICCTLVGDFGVSLRQVLQQYNPDRILSSAQYRTSQRTCLVSCLPLWLLQMRKNAKCIPKTSANSTSTRFPTRKRSS